MNNRIQVVGTPRYVAVQNTGQRITLQRASVNIVTEQAQGAQRDVTAYIPVQTASYTLLDSQLVAGLNILGVDYEGDVDIYLPSNLASTKLVYVKDENLSAGTYNITLHVLQ